MIHVLISAVMADSLRLGVVLDRRGACLPGVNCGAQKSMRFTWRYDAQPYVKDMCTVLLTEYEPK